MELYASTVRNFVAPFWAWKDKSPHFQYLQEFEKTQYWKPELLQSLQWKLLTKMISHAYEKVPFYRNRFEKAGLKPEDLRNFSDYLLLPPLTRSEVQDHLSQLISRDYQPSQLVRNLTGGSTGSPVVFYHNPERMASRLASTLRHNRWAGWDIGDKVAVLWGSGTDLTGFSSLKARLRNLLLDRQLVLDASAITEERLGDFVQKLKRFKPKIILAYASAAYLLARFIQTNQIKGVHPQALVSSAEMLSQQERELTERVLECPVFNRYGSRETSVIASECDQHNGMHVNSEALYLEIIKNGKASAPGEIGEVVITDLLNYGMPFLRYKIGDAASWAQGECLCGRGLPRLEKLAGRVTDFIVTPEGKLVSGASLTIYLITDVPGLKQIQIIQESEESLLFKLVADGNFNSESRQKLTKRIEEMLGKNLRLDFEFVSQIPKEPSGKYRFSISKLTPEFFK
jgi:phenylacetate-CoA ligase